MVLRQEAAALLRRHVAADVGVWATVDPTTVMVTDCLLDGMPRDPELERGVFANEYGQEDVLKLADLVSRAVGAASLVDATGGDPSRSPRYAELYHPRGFDDEARVVFLDEGSPWGALHLLRAGSPFSAAERARLDVLARSFGRALRASLLREAAERPGALARPPGIVVLDEGGRATHVSDEARALLGDLGAPDLPAVAAAITARRHAGLPARAALPTAGGWLVFHAMGIGGADAILVEQPRPLELADLIVRAHGLTTRERQVVECVARGLSTKAVAARLHISEWTVQDHLKAIFAKFGVSTRAELVASVFFDHYAPRHEEGATPSPYGWFLGDPRSGA